MYFKTVGTTKKKEQPQVQNYAEPSIGIGDVIKEVPSAFKKVGGFLKDIVAPTRGFTDKQLAQATPTLKEKGVGLLKGASEIANLIPTVGGLAAQGLANVFGTDKYKGDVRKVRQLYQEKAEEVLKPDTAGEAKVMRFADIASNFIGVGEVKATEKGLNVISKLKDVEKIASEIQKTFSVSEDVAKTLAPKLADVTDKKIISTAIGNAEIITNIEKRTGKITNPEIRNKVGELLANANFKNEKQAQTFIKTLTDNIVESAPKTKPKVETPIQIPKESGLIEKARTYSNGEEFYQKSGRQTISELRDKGIRGQEQVTKWFNDNVTPKEKVLDSLNPTGGLYVDYAPQERMKMPLGKNMTTLDKTAGKKADEMITIYRGAPKNQKGINPGDFITDNPELAKTYGENVISKKVKYSDILDDTTYSLGNEYIYRPQSPSPIQGKSLQEGGKTIKDKISALEKQKADMMPSSPYSTYGKYSSIDAKNAKIRKITEQINTLKDKAGIVEQKTGFWDKWGNDVKKMSDSEKMSFADERIAYEKSQIADPNISGTYKARSEGIIKDLENAKAKLSQPQATPKVEVTKVETKIPSIKKEVPKTELEKLLSEPPKRKIIATESLAEEASQKLASREASQESLAKTIKAFSLPESVKTLPTDVKDKVNLLDYIRTPNRVLEKIGLGKESELVRTQYDKYLKELPVNIEKITKWSKEVSKEGNAKIFKFLDGQDIKLNEEEARVAGEVKTWLKEWADRLDLPEDNRISNYITHIFDDQLVKKEFDEDLAKIIADKIPGSVYDPFLQERLGALGYKQNTWEALDAYVKRATRKVHMDTALEAIKSKAGGLEESQWNYVKKYVDNLNMRPSDLDNLLDNGIKSMIGYKFGQRPTTVILGSLRRATYRAMLGLNVGSALRNISQGINTYAKLGEKYTVVGYSKLLSPSARKEIIDSGILNSSFIQDRALSANKKVMEKLDKGLFAFFETAEKINRGAAFLGSKAKYLKSGKTEEEAVNLAKKLVRDTQFAFDKVDTPVILQSDIVKTLGQFQSYTTKQIEFLIEMAKKKEFSGLLRYAIGGTAVVYTIGKSFGMEPKELLPTFRFDTPPSLKAPVEIVKAIADAPDKYGKDRTIGKKVSDVASTLTGLIPAGTQIKKTLQGMGAISEGASKTKSGNEQFKVGETPAKKIQAVLFGKYSSQEAKDFFAGDNTTLGKYEKLKKLPPEEMKTQLIKMRVEDKSSYTAILKYAKWDKLGLTKEEKNFSKLSVEERAKQIKEYILKQKDRKSTLNRLLQSGILSDETKKEIIKQAK